MRRALTLVLLAGLAACEPQPVPLHSSHRLFGSADIGAGPVLKPGLWLASRTDCRFDEAADTGAWPSCAEWMMVRPDVLVTHSRGDLPNLFAARAYALVDGSPRLLQLGARARPGRPAFYQFEGLRPISVDPEQRIVGARIWGVCDVRARPAPETPASLEATDPADALSAPGPCVARSRAQVRSAVASAEGQGDRPGHWSAIYHRVRAAEH